MKTLIAVIGGRDCPPQLEKEAEEVGRLIARQGWILVCGGLGGVMRAAARGARQEGGITVGILPGDDPNAANPFIDIAIPTGFGLARNLLVVKCAAAVIAIDGGYGTLSEIAYSMQLAKIIIGIGSFTNLPDLPQAKDAREAVRYVLEKLQ